MRPIAHIRQNVLGLTQAELGHIAGAPQGTVSRWERGKLKPSIDELDRIRRYALKEGIAWDDSWFFEIPKGQRRS